MSQDVGTRTPVLPMGGSEQDWLECARSLVLSRNIAAATTVLSAALVEHPHSSELAFALAGMRLEAHQPDTAETLLRALLSQYPGHAAATLLLIRLLKDQGRMSAAAEVACALFRSGRQELQVVIQVVELLDECDRKQDAAAICEEEIAAGCTDPRIHAHSATLLTQLGEFELARRRYSFVLEHSDRAVEWNAALGLAGLQRYEDRNHHDFALFEGNLNRGDLSERARASLLFALGKANDDIGDYAAAAGYLRQGNALKRSALPWSRKLWRRGVEARLARRAYVPRTGGTTTWTPVFIVGMPRSGTTLLGELLARHPAVCNRGELGWIQKIEQELAHWGGDRASGLEQAANLYASQLHQDDSKAISFIDKQPHNFMCVDLILALFPHARVIHCRRSARDNALSLWMQSFVEDAQGFSYDFADIATVIQGSRRLMKHWQARYPSSIHEVVYEQLTANPAACLSELCTWLGLPAHDLLGTRSTTTAISTASLWQARQPVYTRSVERWRHYAPYLPELMKLPLTL